MWFNQERRLFLCFTNLNDTLPFVRTATLQLHPQIHSNLRSHASTCRPVVDRYGIHRVRAQARPLHQLRLVRRPHHQCSWGKTLDSKSQRCTLCITRRPVPSSQLAPEWHLEVPHNFQCRGKEPWERPVLAHWPDIPVPMPALVRIHLSRQVTIAFASPNSPKSESTLTGEGHHPSVGDFSPRLADKREPSFPSFFRVRIRGGPVRESTVRQNSYLRSSVRHPSPILNNNPSQ